MPALFDYLDRIECDRWNKSEGRSALRQKCRQACGQDQGKGIDRLSRGMIVVVGGHELRTMLITCRAGNAMHL